MSEGSSPSSGTFEKSARWGDFSYVTGRTHLRAPVRDLKYFSLSSLRDRMMKKSATGALVHFLYLSDEIHSRLERIIARFPCCWADLDASIVADELRRFQFAERFLRTASD